MDRLALTWPSASSAGVIPPRGVPLRRRRVEGLHQELQPDPIGLPALHDTAFRIVTYGQRRKPAPRLCWRAGLAGLASADTIQPIPACHGDCHGLAERC
jgi:hypothetical protein